MRATEIAAKAAALLSGDREKTHGDKRTNHDNIAALWAAYGHRRWGLNPHDITGKDVACLMVLLKIARTLAGQHNADDYVDAVGYAAIAGEIADQDEAAADHLRQRTTAPLETLGFATGPLRP